jgi:two-component system nitrogen regulation response regulator GlnG
MSSMIETIARESAAFNGAISASTSTTESFPPAYAATGPNGNHAPTLVGTSVEKESWVALLETAAAQMLTAGKPEVMDALGRQFEAALIKTALKHTHGRKNDAAIRLGIGRNTITRKIQELGIEGGKDD